MKDRKIKHLNENKRKGNKEINEQNKWRKEKKDMKKMGWIR